MATKTWGGQNADWFTDADWSPAGAPGLGDAVVITFGEAFLQPGDAGFSVASITLSNSGFLEINGDTNKGSATSTVTGDLTVNGSAGARLGVDDGFGGAGGSTLTIGGTLTNAATATINIGNGALAAATKVTAAALTNGGTLNLTGNATNGTAFQATLAIAAAAPAILPGNVNQTIVVTLTGDADLEFGGGAITGIAAGAELDLFGAQARISIGAASGNTALTTLSSNAGTLRLDGNLQSGGEILTTTTGFTNTGFVGIDNRAGGDGGSTLTIGGTLTNTATGTMNIGNGALAAATTVTVAGLANSGTLNLTGDFPNGGPNGTTNQATLAVGAAAPTTLPGDVNHTIVITLTGDADLEYSGGAITGIAAGAELDLFGAQSRISIGAAAGNTALTTLSSNAGTFRLDGNVPSGGEALTTTTGFTNTGFVGIDNRAGGDGGSTVTIGGTLTNTATGTMNIGNGALAAATNVAVAGLANSGTLNLTGNTTNGTAFQATLAIAAAAPATLLGNVNQTIVITLTGDADLEFGSGAITGIAAGAELDLFGAQSRISIGAAAGNTALTTLSSNAGTFRLDGNVPSGGEALTTTTGFTNTGFVGIDNRAGGDGGSTVTIGGTLTNTATATMNIGNGALAAATNVAVAGLANSGTLNLTGNTTNGTTLQATLAIAAAAPTTLPGDTKQTIVLSVSGDADLEFGSGAITGIAAGAELDLFGAQSRISIGAAAGNTALTTLSSNAGTFRLDGNVPSGGEALTTTTGFTNTGFVGIDNRAGGDGGSTLTIGGTLTNTATGTMNIGNGALAAATNVAVAGLANSGTLNLTGNTTNGTAFQATLAIAAAAPATLLGNVNQTIVITLTGDADLEFGSGAITGIAAGAELDLFGAQSRISIGAAAGNTALTTLSSNAGTFRLDGNVPSGGEALTTTTGFTNTGFVGIDNRAGGDGGSTVTIGGTLTNTATGTMNIGNGALAAATNVAAAGLANSGTLNLTGNTTIGTKLQATLAIAGAATDTGTISLTGDDLFSVGSLTVQNGGSLTVGAGAAETGAITLGTGGSEILSSGGTTSVPMISGGLFDLKAGATVSGTITFAGTGGTLEIEGPTLPNTVAGLAPGDAFDLRGLVFNAGGSATLGANNLLQISESSGSFAIQLNPGQDFTGDTFQLSADIAGGTLVTETPCFCRGTLILTDRGEVAVEELAVGDRVRTLAGRLKPIRWIGFGQSLVTRANKLARPIVVRRGALAENVPARDLYLTHGHALYLDEVLIPVEHLVNHRSILWDESARVVEYYHIELSKHEVIWANGAPAESYHDASNRAWFQNTRVGSKAHAAKSTFAPVLQACEIVEDVWARLFARAGGQFPEQTTDDPDLHLVVDGVRLDPTASDDGVFTFALTKAPAGPLLLRSRRGVPSLLGQGRSDHRPLGVAIERLILDHAGIQASFEHDTPQLREGGCYLPEDGFCWTDGEFALPVRFFTGLNGPSTLIVHTRRHGLRYPVSPAIAAAA